MTRTRIKPPTIHINGRDVPMSGNAKDGYRLRIDELFEARVRYSHVVRHTIRAIRCNGADVMYRGAAGCHEQAAANAVSRWFRDRARKWGYGGAIDGRRGGR